MSTCLITHYSSPVVNVMIMKSHIEGVTLMHSCYDTATSHVGNYNIYM